MKYSEDNLPSKGNDVKRTLSKYMMLKKNGEAWHCCGNLSRDELDWEPIFVYAEEGDYWVGNYMEGLGFCDVRFLKTDCRDMTEAEIKHHDVCEMIITGLV